MRTLKDSQKCWSYTDKSKCYHNRQYSKIPWAKTITYEFSIYFINFTISTSNVYYQTQIKEEQFFQKQNEKPAQ